MIFGRSFFRTIEHAMGREWLVTNGIGGFASSTICGANSRRYHGLLVASLKPPVERHLVLSKIDESIFLGEEKFNLYSCRTPGFVMDGFTYQETFRAFPVPEFCYRVRDIKIIKKVCMVYGQNTTVITYEIHNRDKKIFFRATPLVNFRNYHHCSRLEGMVFSTEIVCGMVKVVPYRLPIAITLQCSSGCFNEMEDSWFRDMEYPVEHERGLDCIEDHFIPGFFEIPVEPFETARIAIKVSIEKTPDKRDGFELLNAAEQRVLDLKSRLPFKDEFGIALGNAADTFIVKRRSTGSKTILAGYPWFTDWGRDTMIALPGITLSTGRYDDAKDILYTFCSHIHNGMVPNVFPDDGLEPAYNSVDASLWFFEAAGKYVQQSGDTLFLKEELLPAMKAVLKAFKEGTMFNIHMDKDFLISAGDENTQLTWMDATVGGRAVTPRWGKAVEVNALWYNALCITADCMGKLGLNTEYYANFSARVKESFHNCFYNRETGCFYDTVTSTVADGSIRPNQVIAAGITHPVIEPEVSKNMVKTIWDRLYTPYGLRTLDPDSAMYKGVYVGNTAARDSAYHQGTVWPWLFYPFIRAYLRAGGVNAESLETARGMLLPFMDHLDDACIGFISEIFDGNSPHYPRGCFAQAWSVAAVIESHLLLEQYTKKKI